MRILSARRIVGVVAAIMLTTSPAFGGAWAIPSGTTDSVGGPLSFSYSNGGDLNGLFNDPFIFGDAFFFTTAFSSASSNGSVPAPQADTLSVDLLADSGLKFGSVSVMASGTYSIDTVGTVDVIADLSMRENTGLMRTFSDSLTTTDPVTGNPVIFPTSTPTGGQALPFQGEALVDVEFVFPTPSDDIHIELINDILAISGAGGSATVNITFQDLRLGFNVIPEPASASLVMIGLFAVVARRRRRR